MTHPLAALLKDVPRFFNTSDTLMSEDPMGAYVHWHDLIAALEAATPPDLVEAGKVLEGVTPGPWEFVPGGNKPEVCQKGKWPHGYLCTVESQNFVADARFIAWCREGVPALIALATAQAAQIAGLTKERDDADRRAGAAERKLSYDSDTLSKISQTRDEMKEQRGYHRNVSFDKVWKETCEKADRAEAAEATAATLRAENERLRGALVEHNDLLRSTFQIAEREGVERMIASTNWDAFYNRVAVVLKRHHQTVNVARAALEGKT